MVNPVEEGRTKPIRIIEYGKKNFAPPTFSHKAQSIFWEQFYETTVLTAFARNFARAYHPGCADIPEDVLGIEYPYDRDMKFRRQMFPSIANIMTKQLSWVLTAGDGDIQGKRILDLGCGSNSGTEDAEEPVYGIMFRPWLCRVLFALGEQPIGVDLGNLNGEKFEAYGGINLLTLNALAFIPDNSVDIVHSRALFTSPQMFEETRRLKPELQGQREKDNIMNVLKPQITRVLKPDGVFVYSEGL